MYINCNDYELLYLINDGNEKALNVLFEKYEHLIRMLAKEYVPYGNTSLDLAQEFRMVLFRCIKCYKDDFRISFYSYFLISVNRKAKKMIKSDYYQESLLLSEECLSYYDSSYKNDDFMIKTIVNLINNKYKDKIYLDIFYDCIIGGISLSQYAIENNLIYANLYYKYKKLCNEIKEFTKKHTILDLHKSLL